MAKLKLNELLSQLKLPLSSTEFSGKRESAVSTNERLQEEAIAVLNVIENPDVAQALRQDKIQNLAYLKEHYNVSFSFVICFLANGVLFCAMTVFYKYRSKCRLRN